MSLKAFHVFFILVAMTFTAAFGWWGLSNGYRALGAGSLALSPCLAAYLVWFLKSKRNLPS